MDEILDIDPTIHPIPPGLWCVPSAIVAITGRDWMSVVHPALNRHGATEGELTFIVTGAMPTAAIRTLQELGYRVRRYTRIVSDLGIVAGWARESRELYRDHTLLLFTSTHCLVLRNGRIYDNHAPHGPRGEQHPYRARPVVGAYLVEKR